MRQLLTGGLKIRTGNILVEKKNQTQKPFDPTEFIHFKNRIGKEGAEKLLKVSVQLFGKEAQEKEVLIDSTVQDRNITYPTDAKQHKRITEKVNKIAKQEAILLHHHWQPVPY
jgi:IS5 family transposase